MGKREGAGAISGCTTGKGSRKDKENAKQERKRAKAQVEEAFNRLGSNELFKEQFIKYFLNKGMRRKNIDELWMNAYRMNIILIGMKPIVREEKPLEILGHVTVFKLVGKEYE